MDTATKIGLRRVLYATGLSNESAQAASHVRGLQQAYQAQVSVVQHLQVAVPSVHSSWIVNTARHAGPQMAYLPAKLNFVSEITSMLVQPGGQ